MSSSPDALSLRCLCIDIEASRTAALRLREVGAYRSDTGNTLKVEGNHSNLARQLDQIAVGAEVLVGHNVVAFDQPALKALHQHLALHRLPVIDTLELSPLAFPENPYHRLVKDYKLCSTVRNDPVHDARLAYQLLLDEFSALTARATDHPDEIACLHFLTASAGREGMSRFFTLCRGAPRPALAEAVAAWERFATGRACERAIKALSETGFGEESAHRALAYVTAWLRVAGGNSVLPAWVLRQYPQAVGFIRQLRDRPCSDAGCGWCTEHHNLTAVLPRYFPGITAFRTTPAMPDGSSMQERIVANGFEGKPTLAVLPTGGGKSLCYQLPALARYYRTGELTIVISPLQALMKDQVDGLALRGVHCAGYVNGLLNPLERQAALERLRLGDLGILLVAPEQFRSRSLIAALEHRAVAAWVFDEAHCLSKWGHDFRPDYLYVSRWIRKFQGDSVAPVHGFTATGKPEVLDDVRNHVLKTTRLDMELLEGGIARENLQYEVLPVPRPAKYAEALRLIEGQLREAGAVVVFCATRKNTESFAQFLNQAGIECAAFHGGIDPAEKQRLQNEFISGSLRVVAATNAFGMGVDKSDVRLVVHLDAPGSLENYIQEAGRAGRDQELARCVLLYDEHDMETQFGLLKRSRLSQQEIQNILKAIRAIQRRDRTEVSVVVTPGEIMLSIPDRQGADDGKPDDDTRVRVAVAWLEEAGLLSRHENLTSIFPSSLLVTSLDEAEGKIRKQLPANASVEPYLRLLRVLLQADEVMGISTDMLVLATGATPSQVQQMLRELGMWRVLSNDTEIGVTLLQKPSSAELLDELRRLENAMMNELREAHPEGNDGEWWRLDTRRLCDAMRRQSGLELLPERLMRLIRSFAEPFGEGVSRRSLFGVRPAGRDARMVRVERPWQEIDRIRERRMQVASTALNWFMEIRKGNTLLVTCKQGEFEEALRNDTTLADLEVSDWDAALRAALLYLDANQVLHLVRGKAIFRAAMTIEMNKESGKRRFSKGDYAELALHYQDRVFQVHVMAEYSRLAIEKARAALRFVDDYFHMPKKEFIKEYFAGREDVLDMATSEESHRRILIALGNRSQMGIVAASPAGNHLILAGPGAGKTKVLVHRVAWLLREANVRGDEILVLSYNKASAMELKRRLCTLVGADAYGVSIETLHGLALRLTGTSFAEAAERGEAPDFQGVVRRATEAISQNDGNNEADGDGSLRRDWMLAGLRFILVDEYQDIDGELYSFLSAVVGRTLTAEEDRLALMVVGDDDQNIYSFRGASVQYIRQFESDYSAQRHLLLENYRSTACIIRAASAVIEGSRDRMKKGQPLRVNDARRQEPEGGWLESADPVVAGRVHVLELPACPNRAAQGLLQEIKRLYSLLPATSAGQWSRFAVIARGWAELEPFAALCRLEGIPVALQRERSTTALHQTREGARLLSVLARRERGGREHRAVTRAGALSRWFRRVWGEDPRGAVLHPWRAQLARFVVDMDESAPGRELVTADIREAAYEFGAAGRSEAVPNGPLLMMTAHSAKGLEFDHVAVLDGGGWQAAGEDERRLFYVAMTRARHSLTLCSTDGGRHAFLRALANIAFHSRPSTPPARPGLDVRSVVPTPADVYLSWPGRFDGRHPVHRRIAALEVGDPLQLQAPREEGGAWTLLDARGQEVGRMAKAFRPPAGRIESVTVAIVLSRRAGPREVQPPKVDQWEVIIPEIRYCPEEVGGGLKAAE